MNVILYEIKGKHQPKFHSKELGLDIVLIMVVFLAET